MQPLFTVSVIIPAYNASATIEKALDSVIRQSYKNLEIIIVDDGSTDRTLEIVSNRSVTEPRLKIISQNNRGVSSARNAALSVCKGDFIRFVDADDTLPPDSVEQMVKRAAEDHADLVIGGYKEYVERLSVMKNLENRNDTVDFESILPSLTRHANSYFYGVLWNKLFSGKLVRQFSVCFDSSLWWGEDFAFVMSYLKHADHIAFMQTSVYEYRRSSSSTSFRQVLDCFVHPLGNIKIKRKLYGYLKGLYQERSVYESYKNVLWHYLFRVGLS